MPKTANINMPIEKKPFRSYTLDEDKPDPMATGKNITIRLNAQEYAHLKRDMKDFNIKNESSMLKFLSEAGRNVLHGTFGRQRLRWLFRGDRVKLEPDN